MSTKGIAYDYGRKAFEKGIHRIPAHDIDFINDIIEGLKGGENSINSMKEWMAGWDSEKSKYK